MGLTQLLGKMEQSQKELVGPDGLIAAGNKPKLEAARREFLGTLFGPEYLGDEEFFRLFWSAQHASKSHRPLVLMRLAPKQDHRILELRVLPESTPLLASQTIYGETDIYQAGAFGTFIVGPSFSEPAQERYVTCMVYSSDNWLLVRPNEGTLVNAYRYTGAGDRFVSNHGRDNVFEFFLGGQISGQYWGAPLVDRSGQLVTRSGGIVYDDFSITPLGIDELSKVDEAKYSFARFYGGLAAHASQLISGYRENISDAEARRSALQTEMRTLEPELAQMKEQMRRLE